MLTSTPVLATLPPGSSSTPVPLLPVAVRVYYTAGEQYACTTQRGSGTPALQYASTIRNAYRLILDRRIVLCYIINIGGAIRSSSILIDNLTLSNTMRSGNAILQVADVIAEVDTHHVEASWVSIFKRRNFTKQSLSLVDLFSDAPALASRGLFYWLRLSSIWMFNLTASSAPLNGSASPITAPISFNNIEKVCS